MIELKDIPKDIFSAGRLIIEQGVEIDKLKEETRQLSCRLFLLGHCPFCGHEGIDKEEGKEIYFCASCKSMMFENTFGGYEVRKAHRVE